MSNDSISYGPFGLRLGFLAAATLCVLLGVVTVLILAVGGTTVLECRRVVPSGFECRHDGGDWARVDLKAATSGYRGGKSTAYAVVLPLAGDANRHYSYGRMSEADAALAAEELTVFARDPAREQVVVPLVYSRFERGMMVSTVFILWSVAGALGIAALRSATRFTIRIEGERRSLRVQRHWWKVPRGSYEVSTLDVVQIELDDTPDMTGMGAGKQEEPQFRIVLRTSTGEFRSLTEKAYRKREVHERVRQQLCHALDLPV